MPSSRPEDSHPRALLDPYVNLSIHTAPCSAVSMTELPVGEECWIYSGSRSNQSRAPLVFRRNRLNLRRAQRMT